MNEHSSKNEHNAQEVKKVQEKAPEKKYEYNLDLDSEEKIPRT